MRSLRLTLRINQQVIFSVNLVYTEKLVAVLDGRMVQIVCNNDGAWTSLIEVQMSLLVIPSGMRRAFHFYGGILNAHDFRRPFDG